MGNIHLLKSFKFVKSVLNYLLSIELQERERERINKT